MSFIQRNNTRSTLITNIIFLPFHKQIPISGPCGPILSDLSHTNANCLRGSPGVVLFTM